MKRKTKFALWVLPSLVSSVALGWAKWNADNPTPTKLDLEVPRVSCERKARYSILVYLLRLSTLQEKNAKTSVNTSRFLPKFRLEHSL